LPENGQWKHGIGQFDGHNGSLAGCPYFAMERQAYDETNHSYLGSWKLVEGLLAARGIQGDVRLFDTSDEVACQLSKVRGFLHSNGFDCIMSDYQPTYTLLILHTPATESWIGGESEKLARSFASGVQELSSGIRFS
jgi:hypothetical protein